MNQNALIAECDFKAVRSSGPGGQHVNKTSTKVVLTWRLEATQQFSEDQKSRIRERLTNRLTKDNVLILTDDHSRSQHKNKDQVLQKFIRLLQKSLHKPKKRKQTKPSKLSKLKRLKEKKINAEKKANRRPPKY